MNTNWSNRRNLKKKLKLSKPYWDDELTEAWEDMVHKERQYLREKSGNNRLKKERRLMFKASQRVFDKLLRIKSRHYHAKIIEEVESNC